MPQQVDGSFTGRRDRSRRPGIRPRYVITADFNGDGRPDLAVNNHGSATVTVLLGRREADSSRRPARRSRSASSWRSRSPDINGDGRTDLAVARRQARTRSRCSRGSRPAASRRWRARRWAFPASRWGSRRRLQPRRAARPRRQPVLRQLSVLLRQPGGATCSRPARRIRRRDPTRSRAPDFNRDGKPDLATSNDGVGNVTVLLNTTPDPSCHRRRREPRPRRRRRRRRPLPAINARLVLSWTITKTSVKLNSATLRDLPAGGATVKITARPARSARRSARTSRRSRCPSCATSRLRARPSFTVTVSRPGYNGLTFSRKVKNYGRTKAALRKAVKAPFSETRRVTRPSGG